MTDVQSTGAQAQPAVRVGFIGAGGIARQHMRQLLAIPGVTITALCDPAAAMIERAREAYPVLADADALTDYPALLAREDVDAVIIATPHTQHFEQALAAIEAKKHVLLEKPMVCAVADAHTLLRRLEGYDRVFALAYQRHAMSAFRYMHERIAKGDLGAVTFISALQCQQWKKGTTGSWRQDPALSGGGQINDSGSHLLDILLWVTGLTVSEVSAFIDNLGTPVDINSALAFRFLPAPGQASGAQGTISVVGDATIWYEDISIWCEHGVFLYRNGALEFAGADGKRVRLEEADMPPGENIDENFIRAIRGEADVAAPPICGLRTIELTEAAWRSGADHGRPVRMN
jgi:predicted dehydrogenase